jgi:hypothetical protein
MLVVTKQGSNLGNVTPDQSPIKTTSPSKHRLATPEKFSLTPHLINGKKFANFTEAVKTERLL